MLFECRHLVKRSHFSLLLSIIPFCEFDISFSDWIDIWNSPLLDTLLHEHWIEFPRINIFFYSRWLNGPSHYAALFLALSVISIIVCIRSWVSCSFLKISLMIINLNECIYYTTSQIATNIYYSFSIMQLKYDKKSSKMQ